jgi:chitin synthase
MFSTATQIKVAKILTFVFAVIMIVVTIGLAIQIAKELKERRDMKRAIEEAKAIVNSTASPLPPLPIKFLLPAGVSTLYLGGLAVIFIVAAFMHPKEFLCLLNGIWYLLCLPSGYLLLTVYSVVNMTDRSCGE